MCAKLVHTPYSYSVYFPGYRVHSDAFYRLLIHLKRHQSVLAYKIPSVGFLIFLTVIF